MFKAIIEKQKNKFYRSLTKRTGLQEANRAREQAELSLLLTIAAKAVAADCDFMQIPMWKPITEEMLQSAFHTARLGFFGNMANNHYIIVKALRALGVNAELVLENTNMDAFALNRPFWEEISVQCDSYESALSYETTWRAPEFVLQTEFDPVFNRRYSGRLSAVSEIQTRYEKDFGIALSADRALLLAQMAGYWPYLLLMKKYEFVQFCNAPTMLAPFCPRPYLLLPSGGELRFSAFDETRWENLLVRAGFRQAASVLYWDSGFPLHLARLGDIDQTHVRWFVNLTDYPPSDSVIRKAWQDQFGGQNYILMPCRQAWADKGNDFFLRAFAAVKADFPEWRVLLLRWGGDVSKTEALVAGLGLQSQVSWLPLTSKALLRRYQATADLVIDHCVDIGLGSSPIEAMAARTAVVIRQRGQMASLPFEVSPPPLLRFDTEQDLIDLLRSQLSDPQTLATNGQRSRDWVAKHLSPEVSLPYHREAYFKALRLRLLTLSDNL